MAGGGLLRLLEKGAVDTGFGAVYGGGVVTGEFNTGGGGALHLPPVGVGLGTVVGIDIIDSDDVTAVGAGFDKEEITQSPAGTFYFGGIGDAVVECAVALETVEASAGLDNTHPFTGGGTLVIDTVDQNNTVLVFVVIVAAGINGKVFTADGDIEVTTIGLSVGVADSTAPGTEEGGEDGVIAPTGAAGRDTEFRGVTGGGERRVLKRLDLSVGIEIDEGHDEGFIEVLQGACFGVGEAAPSGPIIAPGADRVVRAAEVFPDATVVGTVPLIGGEEEPPETHGEAGPLITGGGTVATIGENEVLEGGGLQLEEGFRAEEVVVPAGLTEEVAEEEDHLHHLCTIATPFIREAEGVAAGTEILTDIVAGVVDDTLPIVVAGFFAPDQGSNGGIDITGNGDIITGTVTGQGVFEIGMGDGDSGYQIKETRLNLGGESRAEEIGRECDFTMRMRVELFGLAVGLKRSGIGVEQMIDHGDGIIAGSGMAGEVPDSGSFNDHRRNTQISERALRERAFFGNTGGNTFPTADEVVP